MSFSSASNQAGTEHASSQIEFSLELGEFLLKAAFARTLELYPIFPSAA
jgi:hypothetical protein